MIQTHSLSYRYPGGTALAFPDVDVPQGAVLLLSGPSGCGKSTWLALVAALVAPTSGQITVAGQALQGLRKAAADAWLANGETATVGSIILVHANGNEPQGLIALYKLMLDWPELKSLFTKINKAFTLY